GKATWPGRKQVFRRIDAAGRMAGDVITLADDSLEGEPLLQCVMRDGRRTAPAESLDAVRARVREQMMMLPDPWRRLDSGPRYTVEIAAALEARAMEVDRRPT